MSTNPADMNRQYFTVAELVERERTDTESYPWAVPDRRPRALTPATELLRREGVRIDGASELSGDKMHVDKLLRREAEQPVRDERRPRRTAAIASAAALSGLTIAGLIALSPGNSTPTSNNAAGNPGDPQSGTSPTERGESSPTTTQLKRASNEKQDESKQRVRTTDGGSATGASNGGSAGNGTGTGGTGTGGGSQPGSTPGSPDQPAPPSNPDGPDSPSPQPPPSDSKPAPQPPKDEPQEPNDPVGDLLGGVGDTVGTVGDTLGDTVGGILNPVTGTISGTLNLG